MSRLGQAPLLLSVTLVACPSTPSAREHLISASVGDIRPSARSPASGATSSRPVAVIPPEAATASLWSAPPRVFPIPDRGIFPDLDPQVRTVAPSWLAPGPAMILGEGNARFIYVAQQAVSFAPPEAATTLALTAPDPNDADGDRIPDALDILLGAKKAAANGAYYRNTYRVLPYPGGDLPRDEGVCTDVIIRSLRNAGMDLQQLVHEDILARPGAYPHVKRPDPSIDHRRVRTLLPYFSAHWESLPPDPRDKSVPWLPGDICLLDTLPKPGPDHIGIVSDTLGGSGLPLLVNNWTDGYRTQAMDLLDWVPVTHRFRAPRRGLPVADSARGLAGLLHRSAIDVPTTTRQLVVVTASTWDSSAGVLLRFERQRTEWRPIGSTSVARLGEAGLGRGRGLSQLSGRLLVGQPKREGDRRAPAGLFALGTAFGHSIPKSLLPLRWPWRTVTSSDYFVDDPASPSYNQWVTSSDGRQATWTSAEALDRYELGIVVEHNTVRTEAGAGSAIFLHEWASPERPTLGCTAMDRSALLELLGWLEPEAHPLLLQVPGEIL